MKKFVWVVTNATGCEREIEVVFSKREDAVEYVYNQICEMVEDDDEDFDFTDIANSDQYYGNWDIMYAEKRELIEE